MNEAHSSADRERTIHEENRKLKQENAELRAKYEKETLENKIKILEMQNEIQTLKHGNEIAKLKAKQEKNEEKVVVSLTENALKEENQALKNEIQTHKHQNEIAKLKAQQENKCNGSQMAKEIETLKIQNQAFEKTVAEADLINEFEDLKQEMGGLKAQNGKLENDFQTLENEMGGLEAQNGKLEKEVQALKNGIEGLKVELKDQTQTQKGKLENELQALRNDFEHLKTEVNQKQETEGAQKAVQEKVQKPLGKIPERFFKGAEKFLSNHNTGRGDFIGENYKLWYEDMSGLMENRKQYANQKFVLIRKDVKRLYRRELFFGPKAKDVKHNEEDCDLIVEGLEKRLPNNANVFLLHPNDSKKCSKMKFHGNYHKVNWWIYENVSQDYYFGGEYSVIMLAQFE
ncbi:putative autophagy-related protein 11 [Clytia hemisphaerica]|uniref:putative autophagy-related protein 11 n=1 Tax=Clytia hemisphaerica TaxID=252671 RepID=UPI0034D41F0A